MLDYGEFIEKSEAYECVRKDAEVSKISHAYLFVNSDENYALQFAEKAASILINSSSKLDAEKNDSRIKKHIHPDVMFYGEGDEKINVELVKKIIDDAQVSAFEGDKKILVLVGAQDMNESAQNKLLKTIEEPPMETYFFLLAKSVSKLLPTVLSRVKQISLDTPSSEEIASMLLKSGIDKSEAEVFANCSNGDASFAEKLAGDAGFMQFFDRIVSCFFDINGSRDVLNYSSIFSDKNVDKNEFFDIASLISRDILMIISKKEELVVCKNVMTKLKMVAESLNLVFGAELVKTCLECKRELSFNVSGTAVIDKFLFKLAEVKVKCRRL